MAVIPASLCHDLGGGGSYITTAIKVEYVLLNTVLQWAKCTAVIVESKALNRETGHPHEFGVTLSGLL